MKAGKMFNHILACNRLTASLPEQIQRWLSEEWVADWIEYARQNLQDTNCVLHVDDNFSDIYDSRCCAGYDEDSNSFGSCMVGDEQWTFYRDAVDAKAAYLTLADGMIVARCIVFTNVTDQDGGKWRLAERQYSMFQEPALQRQLIAALIRDGHIDGYKTVGASCGDARKFVDCQGNSLEKMRFSIPCHLEDGDTISYQDSFKWFDYETQVATNYGEGDTDLSTTDFAVSIDIHENDCWSNYNDEYIEHDDAYYVDTRDDFFYENQVVSAYVQDRNGQYHEEYCFDEDFFEIDSHYYYAGRNACAASDYGIYECPNCGEYFIPGRHYSSYSELTEEDYCCYACMEEAEQTYKADNWTYSDYDEEYFEDSDDVTEYFEWSELTHAYLRKTISVESLQALIDDESVAWVGNAYYYDIIGYDGEPVHISAADLRAA